MVHRCVFALAACLLTSVAHAQMRAVDTASRKVVAQTLASQGVAYTNIGSTSADDWLTMSRTERSFKQSFHPLPRAAFQTSNGNFEVTTLAGTSGSSRSGDHASCTEEFVLDPHDTLYLGFLAGPRKNARVDVVPAQSFDRWKDMGKTTQISSNTDVFPLIGSRRLGADEKGDVLLRYSYAQIPDGFNNRFRICFVNEASGDTSSETVQTAQVSQCRLDVSQWEEAWCGVPSLCEFPFRATNLSFAGSSLSYICDRTNAPRVRNPTSWTKLWAVVYPGCDYNDNVRVEGYAHHRVSGDAFRYRQPQVARSYDTPRGSSAEVPAHLTVDGTPSLLPEFGAQSLCSTSSGYCMECIGACAGSVPNYQNGGIDFAVTEFAAALNGAGVSSATFYKKPVLREEDGKTCMDVSVAFEPSNMFSGSSVACVAGSFYHVAESSAGGVLEPLSLDAGSVSGLAAHADQFRKLNLTNKLYKTCDGPFGASMVLEPGRMYSVTEQLPEVAEAGLNISYRITSASTNEFIVMPISPPELFVVEGPGSVNATFNYTGQATNVSMYIAQEVDDCLGVQVFAQQSGYIAACVPAGNSSTQTFALPAGLCDSQQMVVVGRFADEVTGIAATAGPALDRLDVLTVDEAAYARIACSSGDSSQVELTFSLSVSSTDEPSPGPTDSPAPTVPSTAPPVDNGTLQPQPSATPNPTGSPATGAPDDGNAGTAPTASPLLLAAAALLLAAATAAW